jgi:hypothetical protein
MQNQTRFAPFVAIQNQKSKLEKSSLWYPFHSAGDPDVLCVGHFWIWITNTREVTVPRLDIQIVE